MRYTWIDEYLLSKAGVTKDLQKECDSHTPRSSWGTESNY